jgi:hypothetical protein
LLDERLIVTVEGSEALSQEMQFILNKEGGSCDSGWRASRQESGVAAAALSAAPEVVAVEAATPFNFAEQHRGLALVANARKLVDCSHQDRREVAIDLVVDDIDGEESLRETAVCVCASM